MGEKQSEEYLELQKKMFDEALQQIEQLNN